ncbi:hypothetical protein ACQ0P8_04025 [Halodesulfovibrio aestuarii]|uniref:Uncharacterized protein n=1 Tax=Halodesulfovibrio aestuarii TaxID=126333 RepID=A0A8G2C8S1_9BACT|nr:hypothetical protein [Halodesulfovibrio aestuarii]SHI73929.1 hypothetical protein SAMN05660830_00832 [Halodesulfovibrio aestuarii]
MDGYITFEHGELRLGDTLVPGVLSRLSVDGKVRFDEAEQDGLSGKVKVPMGWEDAAVSVTMELLTDEGSTCYDKLISLSRLYKGHDSGGNPMVYRTTNAHLAARNIDEIVFDGLNSSENNQSDSITVNLRFVEHNPPIQLVEKRSVSSTTPDTTANVDPGLSDHILGGR